MTSYHLKIVTPECVEYDGPAEKLIARTTSGDVAILARHINYVAPLGMGMATVYIGDEKRQAACIGGMLSVVNGEVTLLPTTFEWAQEIDVERAESSMRRAQRIIDNKLSSDAEIALAQARLKRALIRKSVATRK